LGEFFVNNPKSRYFIFVFNQSSRYFIKHRTFVWYLSFLKISENHEKFVEKVDFYSSISLSGSGSGFRIRIRIQHGNLNPDPTGSGSKTLVTHCNQGIEELGARSLELEIVLISKLTRVKRGTIYRSKKSRAPLNTPSKVPLYVFHT